MQTHRQPHVYSMRAALNPTLWTKAYAAPGLPFGTDQQMWEWARAADEAEQPAPSLQLAKAEATRAVQAARLAQDQAAKALHATQAAVRVQAESTHAQLAVQHAQEAQARAAKAVQAVQLAAAQQGGASGGGKGCRTAVITVFLLGGQNAHGGSFGKQKASNLFGLAEGLLSRSSGLCSGQASLHVVHDTPIERLPPPPVGSVYVAHDLSPGAIATANASAGGIGAAAAAAARLPRQVADGGSPPLGRPLVSYHYFRRLSQLPPDVRRWVLIDELMRTWLVASRTQRRGGEAHGEAHGGAHGRGASGGAHGGVGGGVCCAFCIDITDVAVLRLPPCAALPRQQVFIATDALNPRIKGWMHKAARRTWLLNASTERYHAMLDGKTDEVIFNNGVVGGRRAAFVAALGKVRARIEANWLVAQDASATSSVAVTSSSSSSSSSAAPFIGGGDMVVWNEVLSNESQVVTGYPFGPVNLPMWGGMCQAHRDVASGRHCAGPCRHKWLNATRGLFWFTHKSLSTWWPTASKVWPPPCRVGAGAQTDGAYR